MTKLSGDDRTRWTEETLEKARTAIEKKLKAQGLEEYAFLTPGDWLESEEVRSVLVVLFPYLADDYRPDANLSLYCRGRDYHVVAPRYLSEAAEEAKAVLGPEFTYQPYADTGPLRDRHLALIAGLGFIGRSQMLINRTYGSYFFIAYVLMNAPFRGEKILPEPESGSFPVKCLECGRCQNACPGGVIRPDGTYDWESCRSFITQKKGELSEKEKQILSKDSLVFGCDICQTVCPYNQLAKRSPIPEFTEDRIDRLELSDLEGLSRRQFLEKYPDRAFTWRGPEVIRRNLRLLDEMQK
ncbi:MAG: epoxyqueuosine reductase [Firmicutes bacterium]|nr:epoxyqueuosine reductase [Bacillota bacterium]